jgi:hypothetical protein
VGRIGVSCSHRHDHIALLVPAVDVPVRLGHLLQPVAPVDDRPDRLRLGQLPQQGQVAGEQLGCSVVDRQADPAGGERPAGLPERGCALAFPDRVEDDVVGLLVLVKSSAV